MQPAKEIIDQTFPGRHILIISKSTQTASLFHKAHPNLKFDLIFIDRRHDYKVAKTDLLNMRDFATTDTILIIDDLRPWHPWGSGSRKLG